MFFVHNLGMLIESIACFPRHSEAIVNQYNNVMITFYIINCLYLYFMYERTIVGDFHNIYLWVLLMILLRMLQGDLINTTQSFHFRVPYYFNNMIPLYIFLFLHDLVWQLSLRNVVVFLRKNNPSFQLLLILLEYARHRAWNFDH